MYLNLYFTWQKTPQGTALALCDPTAVIFACLYDQGVELVVVISQLLRSKVRTKRAFDLLPNFFVFGARLGNAVAFEDAFRISVNDEDRQLACIKQDGIGGLGANPVLG